MTIWFAAGSYASLGSATHIPPRQWGTNTPAPQQFGVHAPREGTNNRTPPESVHTRLAVWMRGWHLNRMPANTSAPRRIADLPSKEPVGGGGVEDSRSRLPLTPL